MKVNKNGIFLVSLIGFIVLFAYFNSEKNKISDFFNSDEQLFLNDFAPLKMERYRYLGEVADTNNHMFPYMNFGKICLPILDQWKNKIKVGDYVSKKKDSLELYIENEKEKYYIHLDTLNIGSVPSPCECKKLSK